MRPDDGDYRAWQLQRDLDQRGDPCELMVGWDAACAEHEQLRAALEAAESARLALQQALGDLLRSCEHVAQVTDDPVYDAAQEIWSASLTTEDERRMRRAALAEGGE